MTITQNKKNVAHIERWYAGLWQAGEHQFIDGDQEFFVKDEGHWECKNVESVETHKKNNENTENTSSWKIKKSMRHK